MVKRTYFLEYDPGFTETSMQILGKRDDLLYTMVKDWSNWELAQGSTRVAKVKNTDSWFDAAYKVRSGTLDTKLRESGGI